MRIRIFQVARGLNSTQIRVLDPDASGPVSAPCVEGRLVRYRPAASNGVPRWSPSATTLESTLATGHRLAVLLDDGRSLWFSSPVVECVPKMGGAGWTVKSENSVYRVELVTAVKRSGSTPDPGRVSLPLRAPRG